jgi:hypothetical protein
VATTYKALAIANELVSELRQRTSLTVALSFDTDSSPLITVGAGVVGGQNALIKVLPISWANAKDVLGNTAIQYGPQKVQVAFEANYAGATDSVEDAVTWSTKLLILGAAFARGTRVELYESANGVVPVAGTLVAGNLKASFEPSAQYPMVSSQ